MRLRDHEKTVRLLHQEIHTLKKVIQAMQEVERERYWRLSEPLEEAITLLSQVRGRQYVTYLDDLTTIATLLLDVEQEVEQIGNG